MNCRYLLKQLLLAISLFPWVLPASETPKPSAAFSFNNGSIADEISSRKARLRGVHFVSDRFGNQNHAVFLSGNESSYISLGNYKAVKPVNGTIAMWAKMESPVWYGTGSLYNPFILTKNNRGNDFYEGYAIYYMLESKRLAAVTVEDSTRETAVFSSNPFERNKWHHLVMSFDTNQLSMYIDGQLEHRIEKRFRTRFLEDDSVVLGATANKKNNRWLNGVVDDVSFYDRVLSEEEVKALYNAPNPNRRKAFMNIAMLMTGILLFLFLLYLLIRHQVRRAVRKEKEKLEFNNKLLETELRVHRASMNPHFLFNSLNALHNLILANDIDNASDYLIKFSRLIRKILDSNMNETITLELEIELLELYLAIENLRFEENIIYEINKSPGVVPSTLHIPIMMLQPFIENAIWHGLLEKDGEKKICITFELAGDNHLRCIIEDNGKGRNRSEPELTQRKPLATHFIRQRLDLMNRIHHFQCSLEITDKPDQQGTIVNIVLPIFR